jgi:hypothetical protein
MFLDNTFHRHGNLKHLGIFRQEQLFVNVLDVFRWLYIIVLKQGGREAGFFISRRVRATRSRPTCWHTTTGYRHRLPPLYRMQHRQSPPRAAAWNIESFLYRQPERRAAIREFIPVGERKTPDCPACTHTRYGNGTPEANLCKNNWN